MTHRKNVYLCVECRKEYTLTEHSGSPPPQIFLYTLTWEFEKYSVYCVLRNKSDSTLEEHLGV